MRPIFQSVIVCAVFLMATPLSAATVHLKDGGEVNCEKVWQEKDTVVARINGDTISFPVDDVNLKRTFPAAKRPKITRKKKTESAKEPAKEELVIIDPDEEKRKDEQMEEYNRFVERLNRPAHKAKLAKRRKPE